MICVRTFAPALEHGNHSNDKQYDYAGAKNLQQHDTFLSRPKVGSKGTPLESILPHDLRSAQ